MTIHRSMSDNPISTPAQSNGRSILRNPISLLPCLLCSPSPEATFLPLSIRSHLIYAQLTFPMKKPLNWIILCNKKRRKATTPCQALWCMWYLIYFIQSSQWIYLATDAQTGLIVLPRSGDFESCSYSFLYTFLDIFYFQ